jgi:hypothetical protein
LLNHTDELRVAQVFRCFGGLRFARSFAKCPAKLLAEYFHYMPTCGKFVKNPAFVGHRVQGYREIPDLPSVEVSAIRYPVNGIPIWLTSMRRDSRIGDQPKG